MKVPKRFLIIGLDCPNEQPHINLEPCEPCIELENTFNKIQPLVFVPYTSNTSDNSGWYSSPNTTNYTVTYDVNTPPSVTSVTWDTVDVVSAGDTFTWKTNASITS